MPDVEPRVDHGDVDRSPGEAGAPERVDEHRGWHVVEVGVPGLVDFDEGDIAAPTQRGEGRPRNPDGDGVDRLCRVEGGAAERADHGAHL